MMLFIAMLSMMMTACSGEHELTNEEKEEEVVELPVPPYEEASGYQSPGAGVGNLDIMKWIKGTIGELSKGKNYSKVGIEYETLDQDSLPVKVSAVITIPNNVETIDRVYLVNHGTHMGNLMVPSSGIFIEESIASSGALCIFPDYIGLGSSKMSHCELYLNAAVHARTSIDALLVLLDYAKQKNLNLSEDFGTYIMGYSQGGAVSLATLRGIQQMPEAQQKLLHLKKVYCGDGPYDLRRTFETYMSDYEQGKPMGLPAVIPMVLSSMFHSYAEETKNINYKDLFTLKAWLTGVPKAIYDNDASVIDVVALWKNFDLGDVLNMKYINAHPDEFNLLLSLMERQNLTTGWELKYPVHFLHSDPDAVVPFANYEAAEQGLKNEFFEGEVVAGDPTAAPLLQHGTGMKVFIANATDNSF